MHTVIRQLEFTLFQLVQQIDDLFNIVQCAMHILLIFCILGYKSVNVRT